MEVLEQFDLLCKKHSVRYFLGCGTLLGAVRGKGFIPWDDDIDIWMLPEDLNRMIRDLGEEIKAEGLELVTPFSDDTYNNLAYRLINTRLYRLDEPFLMKYWMFPFMAGLDIFPLNYVPRDANALNEMRILMISANVLGQKWRDPTISYTEKMETYQQLTELLGVAPVEEARIPNHLWKLTHHIGSMYQAEEADSVAHLPDLFGPRPRSFKKEWFARTVKLEFEGLSLPCPAEYHEVLMAEFGEDYMIPRRIPGEHGYPYYRKIHKKMMQDFDSAGINCPEIYREV
ncbi:MAG: LicD family protein [Lachnospiraceae bacterium]|nr:LicD family protein [Lachnospiraceae bacterium]